MLRTVVLAIFAMFTAAMLLWVLTPLTANMRNVMLTWIDVDSDPQIQTFVTLGDMLSFIMMTCAIFVIGFVVLSKASQRSPYDVSG